MNMRSFAFLGLLTFVMLNARAFPSPRSHANRMLRGIIDAAHDLLKTEPQELKEYVDSGFNNSRCECQDFCIAEKILSPILRHDKLPRALYVYTEGSQNCSYTSRHQYQMKTLVHHIVHCAQRHMVDIHKQCHHNATSL